MSLAIGNKIKQMRKLRGITQEELSRAIGISFQAVSKWENNIALPDITLVPVLAGYFGVSIDELFEFNLEDMKADVVKICDEAYNFRETDPQKSRKIIEEGLVKYPDNDMLLNNLLYVMNYSENPDETIEVASKLASKQADTPSEIEVKYDALRFLAYAYHAKGDDASALAALAQIPQLYFTKLSETAFILSGKPKLDAAEKQKWISFETLLQMMWKIAEYHLEEGDNKSAAEETARAIGLIDSLTQNEKTDSFLNYRDYFSEKLSKMK